jgi:hypothetical protein
VTQPEQGPRDPKDPLGHRDPRAIRVLPGRWDRLARREMLALLDQLAPMVRQVESDQQARRVILAIPVRLAPQVKLGRKVRRAIRATLGRPVLLEQRALLDLLEILEQRDQQDKGSTSEEPGPAEPPTRRMT